MEKLDLNDALQYVKNIDTFHEKQIKSLDSLQLSQVLKEKIRIYSK